MAVDLILNDDGTSNLTLFDESMYGEWEAYDVGKGRIIMENEPVEMIMFGDKLEMSQNGSTLTFIRDY